MAAGMLGEFSEPELLFEFSHFESVASRLRMVLAVSVKAGSGPRWGVFS
jgi:hypothetical protein